ncbi:MAPEG family protein [Rubrimonas cliftonensis]|uniref:Uncharacterized conserved protein, MAPEG superfamily n=1 Tax=Rubrimonas cliftonensis TaxID=89524 RepID=A0A1H4ECB4_9RHOB|nr:MAPEG family protein [Rubrimonas cliftonensis]SEA82681.1 Uncharacterized conserved protein, MAPEG superfamily [Rubrimonas cliftonensis]
MTPELTVLSLALLLAIAQLFLFAVPANRDIGTRYLAGPRDEGVKLEGRTARLQRAFQNHIEGLALFTPAALVVAVSGQSTAFTAACAWAYLLARVVYVPAYAYGWAPWRSAIWAVGLLATVLMLLAALF